MAAKLCNASLVDKRCLFSLLGGHIRAPLSHSKNIMGVSSLPRNVSCHVKKNIFVPGIREFCMGLCCSMERERDLIFLWGKIISQQYLTVNLPFQASCSIGWNFPSSFSLPCSFCRPQASNKHRSQGIPKLLSQLLCGRENMLLGFITHLCFGSGK